MKKLQEIQKSLKAPKSQYNSFGKYNYRNQEDILEAVKPLLGEAELTLSDEIVMLGDRFYVKATATLRHESEEVSVNAYAREAETKKGMDESQITGTASSYARKYALNGLFLIDDNKDADTMENKVDIEQIKKEVAKIENVDELRKYYAKKKGLGEEVAKIITERSEEIKNFIPTIHADTE